MKNIFLINQMWKNSQIMCRANKKRENRQKHWTCICIKEVSEVMNYCFNSSCSMSCSTKIEKLINI